MEVITPCDLKEVDRKIELYDNRIGLILDRNISLISAMYNCFHRQISYIPIDPNFPQMRIEQILSDAEVNTVITHDKYLDKINAKNIICVNADERVDFDMNTLDNDIVYIMYTSGSTGIPKGVEVTREGIFNFIEGLTDIIDFTPGKRIACLTTVSFDIFFLESIMALYKGLTIVLANEEEQRNPKLMAKLIEDGGVDMIQMTPSRMQLLLNQDKELSCLKNIREIMIGGEPFPLVLLQTLQKKSTAKIYNMYGPTETTIWSSVSDLTDKNQIDIGYPIKNTEIYIVDETLSILSNGQSGEICIAGKGLAKGYIKRNELTNQKFIYLSQNSNVKIYRTGDIGRFLPSGELEYLGRIDNQVKIRGHRIELEEIESCLNQLEGITQSLVTVLESNETNKTLVAFYTSDNPIETKKIIEHLLRQLPEYMIPVVFKRVHSFPQTTNGKTDRKRVLECVEIKNDESSLNDCSISELNHIQKNALQVIIDSLEFESNDIIIDTSLSSIGIDSITFVQIVVALEDRFDFEFDDDKILINAFPTIKSMLEYVESKIQ